MYSETKCFSYNQPTINKATANIIFKCMMKADLILVDLFSEGDAGLILKTTHKHCLNAKSVTFRINIIRAIFRVPYMIKSA